MGIQNILKDFKMSKQLNIEVDNNGHKEKLVLRAYSVGDGALAINCRYPGDLKGAAAPFLASEDDIIKFRDTHFRDLGILQLGKSSGQYRLFTPIERASENELVLEGRSYRYELSDGYRKESQNPDQFKVYTNTKRFLDKKEVEVEVENSYIKDSIDFYLKNESKILEQSNNFDNPKAFHISTSGMARESRMSGYNM